MRLAAVALAAGRGERMRPLTDVLPKVLMPVAGTPLLELALRRLAGQVGAGPQLLAVNVHHLADQVEQAVAGRAHVSREAPEALGTAGALGLLRDWIDGRDVLLTNADVYHPASLRELVDGWDGVRCRLLVVPTEPGRRHDFVLDGVGVRYVGSCLLPWVSVQELAAEPTGLYEVLWRQADQRGELDLVLSAASSVDCGTPRDYLTANLHATGGASAVAPTAQVRGRLDRCVVWDGAWVGPDENLHEVIRAGDRANPVTVTGLTTGKARGGTVAPTVTVPREALEHRRATLLKQLGMTLEGFHHMAAERTLTTTEDEAREELDQIEFLLGEPFTSS